MVLTLWETDVGPIGFLSPQRQGCKENPHYFNIANTI